jgi:hypothetical protein
MSGGVVKTKCAAFCPLLRVVIRPDAPGVRSGPAGLGSIALYPAWRRTGPALDRCFGRDAKNSRAVCVLTHDPVMRGYGRGIPGTPY